ncbi:MAG: cytochrome c oxidase subunit [Phycisphaerales bacterium]|nr:cytochrome c oxidase subunit [Phycisphaerales bacterium]
MSDIAAATYVAEDHAPDPVRSRGGDPTLPGKLAIWLFLASEIMFFVAVLGAYLIFRSGTPNLFAKHAESLSKVPASINTVILLLSALTMALGVVASQRADAKRAAKFFGLTLLCASAFLGVKLYEYKGKLDHYTFQVVESGQLVVYDAHVHKGADAWSLTHAHRMPVPQTGTFDLHLLSERDVRDGGTPVPDGTTVKTADITNALSYGPWKNVFFSCYFTLTGIHILHVVGGMVPVGALFVHALRGRVLPYHAEYTGLYESFVALVWIAFLFPFLYLI